MGTVKMTVTYTLSEEGRKKALRNGLPAQYEQQISGDVDDYNLNLPCTDIDKFGSAKVTGEFCYVDSERSAMRRSLHDVGAPFATVQDALIQAKVAWAEYRERVAAKRKEKEKKAEDLRRQSEIVSAKVVAGGPAWLANQPRDVYVRVYDDGTLACNTYMRARGESPWPKTWATDVTLSQQARDIVRAAGAILNVEEDVAKAETERKGKEADARKQAQLGEVVDKHGSPLQQKKWADRFMSRREALNLLIEAETQECLQSFRHVDEDELLGTAVYPTTMHTMHEDYCKSGEVSEVSGETSEKSTLTDGQYEILGRLREALREKTGIKIDVLLETAECKACGKKQRTVFARCEWVVGEYIIIRRVALDE
jgi:hypothetical protein